MRNRPVGSAAIDGGGGSRHESSFDCRPLVMSQLGSEHKLISVHGPGRPQIWASQTLRKLLIFLRSGL